MRDEVCGPIPHNGSGKLKRYGAPAPNSEGSLLKNEILFRGNAYGSGWQ